MKRIIMTEKQSGYLILLMASLTIFIVVYLFIGIGTDVETRLENYDKMDYHLELRQQGTHVWVDVIDSQGNLHTIHPDSLEEFIEKDNL